MDCLRCGMPVLDDDDAYRYRAFKGTSEDSAEVGELAGGAEHTACVQARKTGQRLRIYAIGGDFTEVSVRLVQPDGSEIPLRDIVRAVTIRVEEGEMNVATVVFEGVEFDMTGYLDPASEPISSHT